MRGPDLATRLARTIESHSARCDCPARVVAARSIRWESATFVGARHVLTATADAQPGLAQWVACLPEADLPIADHLVADLIVTRQESEGSRVTLTIEVLTVEV